MFPNSIPYRQFVNISMPPRTGAKLFQNLSFHYPKEADDYADIKGVISSNGGTLTSVEDFAKIKLVTVDSVAQRPPGEYVHISFLQDSLDRGVVQDLDDYIVIPQHGYCIAHYKKLAEEHRASKHRASSSSSRARSPRRESRISTSSEPLVRTSYVPRDAHPATMRNRRFYSEDEDVELILFMDRRSKKGFTANGDNLWQVAEQEKLLGGSRSWQSMQGRWKKQLRPKWDEYMDILESRGYQVQHSYDE